MREIRQSGSEGGGLKPMSPPYPYMLNRHGLVEDSKTVAPDSHFEKGDDPEYSGLQNQAFHLGSPWRLRTTGHVGFERK